MIIEGLQTGKVIAAEQIGGHGILSIRVVSGVVASGGNADILKGEVYLPGQAADPPTVVAIKVITVKRAGVDQERIRRELNAVRLAKHDHILPFIAALQTENYTILVSRFMGNGNMAEYLAANPGAKKEPLISQVADAVGHLHNSLKLVHGDLKCQNVLVSDKGQALLTDFGLSATVGEAVGNDPTVTAIRESKTLRFAAPEILLLTATRSKTTQTDVYAFGMLIIQAFTGTHPWPNVPDMTIYLSAAKKLQYARPEKSLEIGLTNPWWQLCETCLKYEPEERPSMRAICSSIKTILHIRQEHESLNHRLSDLVRGLTTDHSPASPEDTLHTTITSPTEPVPPATTGEPSTRADHHTSDEASTIHLDALTIVDTGAHAEDLSAEGTSDASSSPTGTRRAAGSLLDMSPGTRREGDPDIESSVGGTAMPAAPSVSYPSINSVIVSIIKALDRNIAAVISYPNQSQTASGRGPKKTTLDDFRLTVDCDWGPHFCEVIFSAGVGHLENAIPAISSEIRKNLLENTWTTIMTAINKTGLIDIDQDSVNRVERYIVDRKYWTANAKQESVVVKQVQAWLTKLMGRAEFDLEAAAHIVQAAGITINELRAPGRKVEDKKQTFLDLIILCHPFDLYS